MTAPRRMPRLAALIAVVAALVVGTAMPAQAHNYLVTSTPAEGSPITELPAAFSVTTNATLLDLLGDGSGFALEIVDADGLYYGDGCVTIADATISGTATLGPAGDYRMLWQVISEDGHPVSGAVAFTWAPGADAQLAKGATTAPTCGREPVTGGESSAAPEVRPKADLTDVLWIGGAIAAVLVAGIVTLLVITRKKR